MVTHGKSRYAQKISPVCIVVKVHFWKIKFVLFDLRVGIDGGFIFKLFSRIWEDHN